MICWFGWAGMVMPDPSNPEVSPNTGQSNKNPTGPGWAVIWVLFYLVVTQIPGAILAALILGFGLWRDLELASHLETKGVMGFLASGEATVALIAGLGLAQILSVIYGIVLSRRFYGPKWKQKIGLAQATPGSIVAGMALGVSLFFLAEGLSHLANDYFQKIHYESEVSKMFAPWPWWAGVLIIGLGPALGEEIFCRGFLGRGLVSRLGRVRGVLLTSFLFGIMHIAPIQALYAAVLGIFLHCLVLITGSLHGSIAAHFVNNSLTILSVCDDSPLHLALSALQNVLSQMPLMSILVGLLLATLVFWSYRPVKEKGIQKEEHGL